MLYPSRLPRAASAGVVALAVALLATVVATSAPTSTAAASRTATGRAALALRPLHAVRGANPAILTDQGDQVILRGVDVNSLGDYYQANPAYPTTVPVTSADWDHMAAEGFTVVRLIVSWSKLEPSFGAIDNSYIAQIHQAVDDAAARGMWTVIDMHQDAWGKEVATPPGTTCPAGESPAIGWDGAPPWATFMHGADTCLKPGQSREDSPANIAAWNAFWADENGIQTSLVAVWVKLAIEFSHDPAVAGYDLLNEPNGGSNPGANLASMGAFYDRTIRAIRTAEHAADASKTPANGKVIFFEPNVYGFPPPVDFSADPNVVYAPHPYGGSIAPITVDANWGFVTFTAKQFQTTIWAGEYGWFSDPQANQPKLVDWGHQEDAALAGSAWWQWRQACGDPHSIGVPGGTPGNQTHYQYNDCPGDVNKGVVPQWHAVVARPAVHVAAGRLVAVGSDGLASTLYAKGDATGRVGAQVQLWVPDVGQGSPVIGGSGVAALVTTRVTGGWLVAVTACQADWTVTTGGELPAPLAAACPTSEPSGPSTSPVAAPVVAVPSFTG